MKGYESCALIIINILLPGSTKVYYTPKEKVQKEKQRSTKHTQETKDRVTRTPLKTGGKLRCSGRVGPTSGTRRINLVAEPGN